MVGVIRGQADFGRIDGICELLPQILPVPAPMSNADGKLREERLARFTLVPVAAVEGIFEFEVKVCLARATNARRSACNIGREVSGLTEVIGYHADGFRQRVPIVAMAAMMMYADRGLVHTRNHGGAAGRADRRSRKGVGVTDALTREFIKIGCPDRRCAVAAQVGADILGENPQNIGSILRLEKL